jgi:ubiquinone/menaquinone biosynthesis C-methylase UbiE
VTPSWRWLRGSLAPRSDDEPSAVVTLRAEMNALSDDYDEVMNAESRKTWGASWDELLQRTAARLATQPSGMVLDLGIGTGTCASRFLDPSGLRAHVVGLDHSQRTLRLGRAALRRRLPGLHVDYLVGAGEQLPFADRSFDLVMASCCMHFMDLTSALPELWRVLRPGGSLVIVEPGWTSVVPAIVGAACRRWFPRSSERQKLFFMAQRAVRWVSLLGALLAVGWLMTEAEWRERLQGLGFSDVATTRLARGRRPWKPHLLLIGATRPPT